MKNRLKTLAAALLTACATVSHAAESPQPQSAPQAAVTCLAPDHSGSGRMDWFLGLHPSDDLLSTWCRLQQVPGVIRLNILFPMTKAHRSWDTSFDGGTLPAHKIVELVQSLLPIGDGPAKDEKGMEFPKVLQNVVQLAAERAPDKQILGFAPTHPAAKELVLWEPLVFRIKPIALAGQEFTLFVTMRPSLGLLALGLQGQATDVKLQGWKGRMDIGGLFGNSCSATIPICKDLGEVVSFHAPWVLEEVRLEATGDNMTASAKAIMDQLVHSSSRSRFTKQGKPATFDITTGTGTVSLSDDISTMTMEAIGSAGGTKAIKITWKESGHQIGVGKQLKKIAELYRTGAGREKAAPTVPDILDKL